MARAATRSSERLPGAAELQHLVEDDAVPQEVNWPALAARYNFSLAGPLTPFACRQLVHDLVTAMPGAIAGLKPVALDEIEGRRQRALRECAGLSFQTWQYLFSIGGGLLRSVEAGQGRYIPEMIGDGDGPCANGKEAIRGLTLLLGAVESWRSYMESIGRPVELVIVPTEEEVAEAEQRAEAEARAAIPPIEDLLRVADSANDDSLGWVEIRATVKGGWTSSHEAHLAYVNTFTPQRQRTILEELKRLRSEVAAS